MKITVITQAYNTKKYITQCIESVLNQTHKDFQYILIDNGSTDGSGDIMKEYADSDSRIKFIQFEQNGSGRWSKALDGFCNGDFFTILDSDDWLEPNYLERLVNLAQTTDADIVTTGSILHIMETSQMIERKIERCLVLGKCNIPKFFSNFHVFFRTAWGKLVRTELFKQTGIIDVNKLGIAYGIDTLYAFTWLRKANRICVDNSMLHHYRLHKKSVSHKYDSKQSYSDLYLFNDAVDFLSGFGTVSQQNMEFLYRIYANAIRDTGANLFHSSLKPSEKIHEYNKILLRQVTQNAYAIKYSEIEESREVLLTEVIMCADELTEENDELRAIMSAYLPNCGAVFTKKTAHLFRLDKGLFDALISDNKYQTAEALLRLFNNSSFAKQFDIPEILRGLSKGDPLLGELDDVNFLRRFGNIYLMIYRGGDAYGEALDAMTDILLKEPPSNETFMSLYISLAAMLECVDEFIFGKIKLALFYVNGKHYDECRAVLAEISEMGVEDNDEIISIKASLY